MKEKLQEAQARYEALCAEASLPQAVSDPVRYRELTRELSTLEPVVSAYRRLCRAEQEEQEARELMQDAESDSGLRRMAEEEMHAARHAQEDIRKELLVLLLPHDPNDDKNVIMEIRAGAGGEEAALFAAVLYRMYTMYAASAGFSASVISANETGLGGYREISFLIEGKGAYSRLKYESGVHRVQRVPETESGGRIHTSTVTVAVLPEAEEIEVEIRDSDIRVETIKSSGAGGQHVNKTESAVRLIHIPSGIVIECQDERSQFKNRDKAMKLLRTRLFDQKQAEQNQKIASERRSQVGSGDRSERVRTYNYPQSRITDHRIGLTLHSLESFLNGDIGQMLDALGAADTAEKLRASGSAQA